MFQSFDPLPHPDCLKALAAVWSWTESAYHGEVRGLVLWGTNFGSGKSHLARAADKTLISWGKIGNFYPAPRWFGAIKETYDKGWSEEDLFAEWGSRPYFILDDIGKQYATSSGGEWAKEKLFRLLDALYSKGRSILLTCNLTPRDLLDSVGGATWSRLAGMTGKAGFVDMSHIPDFRMAHPKAWSAACSPSF